MTIREKLGQKRTTCNISRSCEIVRKEIMSVTRERMKKHETQIVENIIKRKQTPECVCRERRNIKDGQRNSSEGDG